MHDENETIADHPTNPAVLAAQAGAEHEPATLTIAQTFRQPGLIIALVLIGGLGVIGSIDLIVTR